MNNNNEEIVYSKEEIVKVFKIIEVMLISLHKMGSYYGEKIEWNNEYKTSKEYIEYCMETTRFIDECKITTLLADIRYILCNKLDDMLELKGDEEFSELEKIFETLEFWHKPGDKIKV